MVRKFLFAASLMGLMCCLPLASSWGRGFGGGGGHMGGGGMPHGGGFGGAGGFGGGAHGPGGFGGAGGAGHMPGNAGGGGFSGGGQHPGGFGAGGAGERPGGGGDRPGGFSGDRPGGFSGDRPGGFSGDRPGGAGGENRFATPDRGELNRFLGMPSDEGLHGPGSFGVGPGNRGIGTAAGIGGGRAGVGAGGVGRPGVGPVAADRAGGFGRYSASDRYAAASAVRHDYNHWGYYNHDWYNGNPGAWFAAGWATGAAWNACAWTNAALYCGYANAAPMYYDYGNNVTYQDNSVYVNQEPVGTSEEYYNQAATIASTGASAPAPSDGDWLPLGVFALTKSDASKSDVTIQLAVNKDGVIRGNSTDTQSDKNQVIQGSVDKKTQRVAFTVGENTEDVVETGLYNLTKDEAPCLIHFGKDKTEQWLLVRLQKPADDGSAPQN